MGDFNARTNNLLDVLREQKDEDMAQVDFFSKIDTQRANQDNTVNRYGRLLTEYCIATRSYIANGRTVGDLHGKYTCHEHRGSSTVDYAIINENLKNHIESFQVLDPNTGSDHCAIAVKLILPHIPVPRNKNLVKLSPKIIWNEETKLKLQEKMNSTNSIKKVEELEDKVICADDNTDEIINELIKIITPEETPKRKKKHQSKKKTPPKKWYDSNCHELSKKLKNVAELMAKSPSDPYLRGSFCKTRKQYKKLLKWKKREWKNTMISKLENLEQDNPKEYWKIINELREKKQKETSFDTENFSKFFEKLFSKTELTPKTEKEMNDFITKTLDKLRTSGEPDFTLKELIHAIKILKNNKAAGPDRIPAEILKICPLHILKLILKIMNKIKQKTNYPLKWALGITSLLFKEGDDADPNNYRAITVSDTLSKVLAIMLNERIEKWTKENKIICKEQIGFEKKTRPSDHLLVIKTLTDSYTNAGKKLFACFVDFQKAFDSVWRTRLFYQLIKYGMNTETIKLIKDMYEKTSICLKLNGLLTPPFRTYRGVRQGCSLSPKLFNILINDIPQIFDDSCSPVNLGSTKLNCLMYADDLVILSTSETGLQECLNRLHKYTTDFHLSINMKKTKIIAFYKNGHIPKSLFYLGDQVVEKTKSYKYLGSIITNTGNFNLNEINLKKKGLRASYLISKIGVHAKPSSSIKIFEKVVEPILLYNCEVSLAYFPKSWTIDKFKKNMWKIGEEVNKVTLSFLRQLLGVHKKTSNLGILSETGKYPLSVKIFTRIIKYWYRLETSENELLKASKETNLFQDRQGLQNWHRIARYLIEITNMKCNPSKNELENKTDFKTFEQRIKDTYDNYWMTEMASIENRKLQFLWKYKKTFKFEKYLDAIPRSIRQYTTRLRTSSHSYPIETLRYVKPEIDAQDRKCTICNLDDTGDELHYLLRCTNENIIQVRNSHLKDMRNTIDQFHQFNDECIVQYCLLMNDHRTQLGIANYIKAVAETYKEEAEEKKTEPTIITKSGRLVRKPIRLDL